MFVDFFGYNELTQVRELETDPLFNSGRGSALTEKGTVEMEASIMDGTKRRCGAVSGITTVKNPISLARLVMDKSPHSYLAFSGAEEFARKQVSFTLLHLHFSFFNHSVKFPLNRNLFGSMKRELKLWTMTTSSRTTTWGCLSWPRKLTQSW